MTETETNLPNPFVDSNKQQELLQRLELKLLALKERLTTLVTNYEDQDAERRVEITLLTNKNKELTERVQAFETAQQEATESAKPASD